MKGLLEVNRMNLREKKKLGVGLSVSAHLFGKLLFEFKASP